MPKGCRGRTPRHPFGTSRGPPGGPAGRIPPAPQLHRPASRRCTTAAARGVEPRPAGRMAAANGPPDELPRRTSDHRFEQVGRAEPSSTGTGVFPRPQPGEPGVIQNSSTGATPLRSSTQVRCLCTCAQPLSTGCGQRTECQQAARVIHCSSPGWGRLSPAFPQLRPQFDNIGAVFTRPCERRHVMLTGPRG